MALAQEEFSTSKDDDGVSGASDSDDAEESTRVRACRTKEVDEVAGKLAHAVDELKVAEDAMRTTLADVQRVLHRIEARRVHEDAGYATCAEFEERMLAWAPLVRVMREVSGRARTPCPQVTDDRRDPSEDRSRSVKALSAIAHALTRIRSLESEMRASALRARATLEHVDAERLFEECGYASYEEFLERAVGPSPLLGCALASLVVDTTKESGEAHHEVSEDELLADEADAFPAALGMSGGVTLSTEVDPTAPTMQGLSPEAPRTQNDSSRASRRLVALSIVAVVVSAAAGLGGAYTSLSMLAPPDPVSPEAGSPVRENPTPAVSAVRPPKSTPSKATPVHNAKDMRDALDKTF